MTYSQIFLQMPRKYIICNRHNYKGLYRFLKYSMRLAGFYYRTEFSQFHKIKEMKTFKYDSVASHNYRSITYGIVHTISAAVAVEYPHVSKEIRNSLHYLKHRCDIYLD